MGAVKIKEAAGASSAYSLSVPAARTEGMSSTGLLCGSGVVALGGSVNGHSMTELDACRRTVFMIWL